MEDRRRSLACPVETARSPNGSAMPCWRGLTISFSFPPLPSALSGLPSVLENIGFSASIGALVHTVPTAPPHLFSKSSLTRSLSLSDTRLVISRVTSSSAHRKVDHGTEIRHWRLRDLWALFPYSLFSLYPQGCILKGTEKWRHGRARGSTRMKET